MSDHDWRVVVRDHHYHDLPDDRCPTCGGTRGKPYLLPNNWTILAWPQPIVLGEGFCADTFHPDTTEER